MKIVEINSVPYGSTGMIARNIADIAKKNGESYFFYSWTKKRKANTLNDEFLIGNFFEKFICLQLEKITGNIGKFSILGTKQLIKQLDAIKPDVVHLHNLHEGYINYKILFTYLKEKKIRVVWTLHDCWAFTGHCPHFQISKCEKWKTECNNCPSYKEYPKSLCDNSKKMYKYKKKWFTHLDEYYLTIVVPSKWLSEKVKKSFLNKYQIKIINNGINLNIFKPISGEFRKKYNLENKFVLLGVAMDWGVRKGLDVFVNLARDLDEHYKIILVGTNEAIDKMIPKNIISIHRTADQTELAEIYSAADLFVNPTREDNFPTVNIESLACGTPILTYNTGGSPEIIDSTCGTVVDCDDYEALKKVIIKMNYERNGNNFKKSDCLNRAKKFNYNDKFHEYILLFNSLVEKEK